jgi:hypothetical protein
MTCQSGKSSDSLAMLATDPSAGNSLDEMALARAGIATRVVTPWWFHPMLGLLVGQHVLVQGVDNRNWTLPSFLVFVIGATGLVLVSRAITGVSVATPRGPRTRDLMGLRVLVPVACIWTAALVGGLWFAVPASLVATAATIVLGRRFDTALRDELAQTTS